MSAAFTPEQEARIREIVGEVAIRIEERRAAHFSATALDDMDTAVSWVLNDLNGGDDA